MFFIVLTTDRPDSLQLRLDNRPEHIAYLESFGDALIAAGATQTDDGEGITGSFILIDVEDRAAAEDFARDDPFAKVGLFSHTEIRRWRKAIFHPIAE